MGLPNIEPRGGRGDLLLSFLLYFCCLFLPNDLPPPPLLNYLVCSTPSVVGQTAAVYSHFSGAVTGGHQRHMSFGSSYTVVTPSTSSSCGSPSTPFAQPMMATTPPSGTQSLQQQQQQQPSPPFTVRRGEQQQQPQQQQQQIRDSLPPLSTLSPKTAAAALGMGTRKGAAVGAASGELSSCRLVLLFTIMLLFARDGWCVDPPPNMTACLSLVDFNL